jgi:hypothetical protein
VNTSLVRQLERLVEAQSRSHGHHFVRTDLNAKPLAQPKLTFNDKDTLALHATDSAPVRGSSQRRAWGAFGYDEASGTFSPANAASKPPQGNDAKCGFACHTGVVTRDYVFTQYGRR